MHDVVLIIQLDRDGLQDLNIQADWQRKGGTYWVRYIHVELQGFVPTAAGMYCSFSSSYTYLDICKFLGT